MGRTVNMFGIMVILVAALIQSSSAQTTHVVGDSLGWVVPPGSATYSTWAANKTFSVGDILVFNYVTGNHDVAEVTMASFDSCSSTSPISLSTTGPTTITLNSTGNHYFICTFGSHCSFGQKVAVNVSTAATPPAPQPTPATPPPTPQPTPATPPSTPTTTPSPPPTSMTPTPSPSPVSTPPPSPSNSPMSIPSPAPSGTATPPSGTATPPSGTVTPPPSGTVTPPPSNTVAPPPPNGSGPSLTAAALPVTLLSIAMALFY